VIRVSAGKGTICVRQEEFFLGLLVEKKQRGRDWGKEHQEALKRKSKKEGGVPGRHGDVFSQGF